MAVWMAAFIFCRLLIKKTWQNTCCITELHVAAHIYSKLRLLQDQDLNWQNKELANFWMIWSRSTVLLLCDAEHQASYIGLSVCYLPWFSRWEEEFSGYCSFFFFFLCPDSELRQLSQPSSSILSALAQQLSSASMFLSRGQHASWASIVLCMCCSLGVRSGESWRVVITRHNRSPGVLGLGTRPETKCFQYQGSAVCIHCFGAEVCSGETWTGFCENQWVRSCCGDSPCGEWMWPQMFWFAWTVVVKLHHSEET